MLAMIQQIRDMSNAQKILVLLTFIIFFCLYPSEYILKTNVTREKMLHNESILLTR